jgi:hypothetical protein
MPRLPILVPALLAGALFTQAETVRVTGTVCEGETFAKPVGRGLHFCLIPEAEYGWRISLAASCTPDSPNFAMIATPPYRGVNPIHLYSWHFVPGAQILPKNRNFQFVLHERDYEGIMTMLRNHHDAGETLERVNQLGKGKGELRVESAKTAPGTAKERPRFVSLRFSATLTLPGNSRANDR